MGIHPFNHNETIAHETLDAAELDRLLTLTSRTFALCIPRLPSGLRREVSLSYLLYRVADTIEDGDLLTQGEKVQLLDRLIDTLLAMQGGIDSWMVRLERFVSAVPTSSVADLELHRKTALVLAAINDLAPETNQRIVNRVVRSVSGMRQFVDAGTTSGGVLVRSEDDLRQYCYYVAGIVGELLTDLFLLSEPQLDPFAKELRRDAASFGEALQLVNIMKDSAKDLDAGRKFIPDEVPVERLIEILSEDLARAKRYVHTLREAQASHGVIEFTEIPLLLAEHTIEQIRVDGPGAKVSRSAVQRILQRVSDRTAFPGGDGQLGERDP